MPDTSSPNADELVIAVYLDTNALLDLLATVQGGFSLVERVTSGQTTSNTGERAIEAGFATPGVLNFFKLGLSGKLARSTSEASSGTTEAELTHTYGSLLHRLRGYLIDEDLVATITPSGELNAPVWSFIEFAGVVRPNPFTATFRQLQRMFNYVSVAAAFSSAGSSQPPRQPASRRNPQQSAQSAALSKPQLAQLKAMGEFFDQLTKDVEREGTNTVLLESQTTSYRAIVTLYEDFLRDRSMAELLNREFRVLGKIARNLPGGSSEKVDLIASSGIAGFSPEILGGLQGAVAEMSASGAAGVPQPSMIIDPPVVEIVPIAIYV